MIESTIIIIGIGIIFGGIGVAIFPYLAKVKDIDLPEVREKQFKKYEKDYLERESQKFGTVND